MPERRPIDGPVALTRSGDNLVLSCTTNGSETSVVLGPHNAWRAFGLLALMLDLPLLKRVARAIVLTAPGRAFSAEWRTQGGAAPSPCLAPDARAPEEAPGA